MIVLEVLSLSLMLALSVLTSRSDCKSGIIKNRHLAIFFCLAAIIDFIYYGFFMRELLGKFLWNVFLVSGLALCLFYSHSFAGGDCKLAMVLALFYPARFYVDLNGSTVTLYWAIALSILSGFCYMFVSSIYIILSRTHTLSWNYIKTTILSFGKNYISAMLYLATFNLLLGMIPIPNSVYSVWFARISSFILIWCIWKYPKMRNKIVLLVVGGVLIALSIVTRKIPISLQIGDYALVLSLLLAQIIIKTTIYEEISVEKLKKGMILSTFSSSFMQTSITKNLPTVSTENLKSRLTAEEVEAAKIWARATKTKTFTIVRKIPFAIFLSIGFLCYFVFWSVWR